MKTAILASSFLAGSAAAFTTNAGSQPSTALKAMPERKWDTMVDKTQRSKAIPFLPRPINLDGSMVGDMGFDPFYLSSIPKDFSGFIQPPSWEQKTLPTLYWMREAELKHSRVCMLAWFGWLATDGAFGITLRFPGEIYSVESIPTAYEAHDVLVNQGSMGFLLLAVSLVEFCTGAVLVEVGKGDNDRAAGDYGLDPLNFLKDKSQEEKDRMAMRELANGRLAMLAFAGVSTQAALSDATHAFPYF
jgi:light-harvesting complex I chlorophyll a/b binding protein 1